MLVGPWFSFPFIEVSPSRRRASCTRAISKSLSKETLFHSLPDRRKASRTSCHDARFGIAASIPHLQAPGADMDTLFIGKFRVPKNAEWTAGILQLCGTPNRTSSQGPA
ncbi:MAG: hypothetical protein QOE55_4806 [Acidobacteriaceae bacterium]|nr:hypothetical protein [Acidobacteriaceae bacterium]